jgi:hypothetical protein
VRPELCSEDLLLLRADGGRATGMRLGIERTLLTAQGRVAFDGRQANPEGAGCLALGHAGIDCGQDLGSQVGGVSAHPLACHLDQ